MPAVTRVGDLDVTHCSAMRRATGSSTVFVNSRPVSFQTCVNTPHLIPGGKFCISHVAAIQVGSTTVKVHGMGMGRVFDTVGPACTAVAQGSTDIFAGG
jgi:hypothetical protein